MLCVFSYVAASVKREQDKEKEAMRSASVPASPCLSKSKYHSSVRSTTGVRLSPNSINRSVSPLVGRKTSGLALDNRSDRTDTRSATSLPSSPQNSTTRISRSPVRAL